MKRLDESTEPPPPGEHARAPGPQARLVARIVDPAVREDGRGDPQLVLHVNRGPAGEAAPAEHRASHPVRDRLLARARLASSAQSSSERSSSERSSSERSSSEPTANGAETPASERAGVDSGESADASLAKAERAAAPEAWRFESLPELADDLDLIGAPERARTSPALRGAAPLTPPAALLLGTLFGVTVLAVTFTVLIRVAPPTRQAAARPPLVSQPAPTSEAAAEPTGSIRRAPRRRVEAPWRIADAAGDARLEQVHGSVGGDSFLAATRAAGVSLKDAYRVMAAFEGVKNLDRCRPKDAFTALLDAESKRLTAFEYRVTDEEVYQARESKDGLLVGRKLDLSVRRDRVQGVVVVHGGFEASALEAGFDPGLSDVVGRALSGYSSLQDLRDGDVLAMVAQEVTVLGAFSRYAGVEALEYRPVAGDRIRIYYHESEKKRGYVDSRGRVFGKSRWARPVPGAGISSRFNPKRRHPILKIIKPHNGTDFGAAVGTPVVASAVGKVSFVGKAGPNGNMVTLQHAGGFQTGYSHLSRFAKGLKVGNRVEQKQLVGYVGSTGRSTGPHLHFSAKKNGRFIDPESLELDALSKLAVSEQKLLSELRQRYDHLLDELHIPEPRAPDLAARAAPPGELEVTINAARPFLPGSAHDPAAAAQAPATTFATTPELLQPEPAAHDDEAEH